MNTARRCQCGIEMTHRGGGYWTCVHCDQAQPKTHDPSKCANCCAPRGGIGPRS